MVRAWSRWQDWTNLIAGAWLFASPWLVGYAGRPVAAGNAWILGPAIMVFALWALAEPAARAVDWWLGVAAAWVFVAPWLLGFAAVAAAAWNAWALAVALAVVTIWSIASVGRSRRARRPR